MLIGLNIINLNFVVRAQVIKMQPFALVEFQAI